MRPIKEKIMYDNRNLVWKRVQNQMWFEVWGSVSRGMRGTVNIVWINVSSKIQEKV